MRAAPFLLAGFLSLTYVALSSGNARESYRKGIWAVDRREWAAAERFLRLAKAPEPIAIASPPERHPTAPPEMPQVAPPDESVGAGDIAPTPLADAVFEGNPEGPTLIPPAPATEPVSGPPMELRIAARALFQGDAQVVIRTLAEKRFAEKRARAASHLLQAAAQYSLYAETGDIERRNRSLEEIFACRRLEPGLRPTTRWFSPGFVRFFDNTGPG